MLPYILTALWLVALYVVLTYRFGEWRFGPWLIVSHPLPDGGFYINGWTWTRTRLAPGVYRFRGTSAS